MAARCIRAGRRLAARATHKELEKLSLPGSVLRSISQGRSFSIPSRPGTSGSRLLFANVGAVLRASVPALAFVVPDHRWQIQPDDRVMRAMPLSRSRGRELLQVGCVADIEHPESNQHDRCEEETAHIRSLFSSGSGS